LTASDPGARLRYEGDGGKGFEMKVIVVQRLQNSDHAKIRAGLENFEKSGGPPGMEGLWLSADAKTIFAMLEVDDLNGVHTYMSLYSPYVEDIEVHVVTDAATGVANMKAALDMSVS
jgi:hypothetical protein